MNFLEFFQTATGGRLPYLWQCRLACGGPPEGANCDLTNPDAETKKWLAQQNPCFSRLIDIPTGLGKTAGVVLAWIWNLLRGSQISDSESQIASPSGDAWPRRLVYCLPMRTLVEQTTGEIEKWLENLCNKASELGIVGQALEDLQWFALHSPILLMGGEELDENRKDWHLHPERPAILVGTQDMLLSRALNRGYAASRARWPIDFALLNNDCLWVMDEVQLMSNGLSSSLQLQAWRYSLPLKGSANAIEAQPKNSSILPTHTWWMSATMAEHWFQTAVDWKYLKLDTTQLAPKKLWGERVQITDDDKKDARVAGLFAIQKTRTGVSDIIELKAAGTAEKKTLNVGDYAKSVADFLADENNRKGKKLADTEEQKTEETANLCTLIVVNTVERAIAIFNKIKDKAPFNPNNVLLLHSRFRGHERKQWPALIKAFEEGTNITGPRLIIATQVIEAGVDISVPILYTERCPMSSLIQRVGRCARRIGETGKVYILPMKVDEATAKPYDIAELEAWQP
jgi:CRISPR-associated endonuclease/helicase Cas3